MIEMMATFLKIMTTFFKIGLLTVGGGLAMIPVIQQELERLGWLNSQQFLDILGIAQMTPGAISVNTATFSGYRVMSSVSDECFWIACLGALAGTISVCAPSLICVNAAGRVLKRYREHGCFISVFSILRPLVTGLIISASVFLLYGSVCGDAVLKNALASVSWFALAIAVCAFVLAIRTQLNPVLILLGGLLAGFVGGLF